MSLVAARLAGAADWLVAGQWCDRPGRARGGGPGETRPCDTAVLTAVVHRQGVRSRVDAYTSV